MQHVMPQGMSCCKCFWGCGDRCPRCKTLEEAEANLIEAVQLVLRANRELAEEEIASGNRDIVKEFLGSVAL